jgi:hypothetical protein
MRGIDCAEVVASRRTFPIAGTTKVPRVTPLGYRWARFIAHLVLGRIYAGHNRPYRPDRERHSSRTATLFKDLFGAAIVTRKDVDGHEETYVRLGRTWFVLAQAEAVRPRSGDHIAFSVSKSTLLETAEKLKIMNVEFFLARSDTALYFFDYDNHVFELDTTDLDRELAG